MITVNGTEPQVQRASVARVWRTWCALQMLRIAVGLQTAAMAMADAARRVRREEGQAVAEYALVLLVAAAIAGAFLIWARQSGRLDAFFDAIFERLMGSVDPEEGGS